MTTIIIRNVWTSIKTDDQDVIELARDIASYTMKNWEIRRTKWMQRLRRENKDHTDPPDGCKCVWCRADRWTGKKFIGEYINGVLSIPTGCLTIFLKVMDMKGKSLIFDNERYLPPQLDVDWSLKREPRPYQSEAIDAIMASGGRGIIKSPTASGKSVMIAMLINRIRRTTLIKVPRLVLMTQIRDEILDTLNIDESDVGIIGGGKMDPSLITIATTQTLSSKMKQPLEWSIIKNMHDQYGWGLLIEDECHHAASDTSYNTSMSLDSYYRVGFSATPLMREDGQNIKVIGAYGDLICDIPSEPLIASGWLIRPTIKFIPLRSVPTSQREKWQNVYDIGIVHNRERNLKIIEIANAMFAEGRSTLIFVDRIEHGEELMNTAPTYATHNIEFIHGTHPDRDDILARFKAKTLRTMISTEGIIGEGFDFRGLDALIIADGGKSAIQTLQKVGRAMRIDEGKVDCKIFDFADRCKYLTDHALSRKTTWLKHGFVLDLEDTPYMR